MALTASIVFFLSLAGIAALFTLKSWEFSHERILLPDLRSKADRQALHLKELLDAGGKDLEKVPPLFVYACRQILRGIALDAGRLMGWLSLQAHKLADAVSHKRNFTKVETRSEFLKKVSEHKNGNGESGTSNV